MASNSESPAPAAGATCPTWEQDICYKFIVTDVTFLIPLADFLHAPPASETIRLESMPNQNLDAVRELAPDLRATEPRSPHDTLAGHEFAARALDKCRASLVGWNGDYEFNCPLDQRFFRSTRIDANAFRDFVATGASDEEVSEWIEERSKARSHSYARYR